jgi:hypothetical protein
MTLMQVPTVVVRRAACVALAVTALLAQDQPALATGSPLPRIREVQADLEAGQILIRGENFVRRHQDDVSVALSGEALSVLSLFPSEIVALLPAGIEPGTYRLSVVRGGILPLGDAILPLLGQPGLVVQVSDNTLSGALVAISDAGSSDDPLGGLVDNCPAKGGWASR